MSHSGFMRQALIEAEKALAIGEVPVGAVVVFEDEIIGRGYNQREMLHDPTAHAEILALREAAAYKGGWRLTGCTLYVTLEPCPMCAGAIVLARIKRLVYAANDPKSGAVNSILNITNNPSLNHQVEVKSGVLADESSELLKSFFKYLRNQV